MNTQKFQQLVKFLSSLLKMVSIMCFVGGIGLVIMYFVNKETLIFASPSVDLTLFHSFNQDVPPQAKLIAGIFTALPLTITYGYVFWRSSAFFNKLSKGQTPFSLQNYRTLKEIGIILVIVNFIAPLFYSLIATLNMPEGHYISFGIDTEILVGLVIYCMAEVIRYGITLQELSDETV